MRLALDRQDIACDATVRPARLTDAPGLARLLRAIGWFSALQGMTPEQLEMNVQRHLDALIPSRESTTLVAEAREGALVGYCNVHWLHSLFMPGPEGYLSELFVLPESRGQGIGSALLHHIVLEAEERGAYRLMLLNGRHRESYSRGFYTRQGWEERERMANFVFLVGGPGSVT